jgi:hypothetical protein
MLDADCRFQHRSDKLNLIEPSALLRALVVIRRPASENHPAMIVDESTIMVSLGTLYNPSSYYA